MVVQGVATIQVVQAHAIAGTLRFPFDPFNVVDNVGAVTYSNPVLQDAETVLWVASIHGVVDTGANLTRAAVFSEHQRWRGTPAGARQFRPLFLSNTEFPDAPLAGGGTVLTNTGAQNTAELGGRAFPEPMKRGDLLHVVSTASGIAQVDYAIRVWVGSDGGPPPGM